MAIYHASMRVLSRSRGESAVAAAAYRAGVAMHDDRLGLTQDYSRRRGVDFVTLVLPAGSPVWATDANALWNAVEAAEPRVNSRVARELIVGLPHELGEPARRRLALAVATVLMERYGVPVQLAIHAPDRGGDQRNHHAHLLFAGRVLGPDGFGTKVRILDEPKSGPQEIHWLRAKVAELTNAALTAAGVVEQVDHRTLKAQAADAEASGDYERAARLTREPTRHVGRSGMAAFRRGRHQETVAHNRAVIADNQAALDAYLLQARATGRLMPAASDHRRPSRTKPQAASVDVHWLPGVITGRGNRASGKDAAVLNAQTAQVEAQQRATQAAADEYIASLSKAGKRLASPPPYVSLYPHQPRLSNDPEVIRLRAALTEARRNLHDLKAKAKARQEKYKQAKQERERRQREADTVPAQPPSRWHLNARKQWEGMRRARFAKLRAAIAAEQAAKSSVDPKAMADLQRQAQALRSEVERLDHELTRRLSAVDEPEPIVLPRPDASPRTGLRPK